MQCQSLFYGEIMTIFINFSSSEFSQRVEGLNLFKEKENLLHVSKKADMISYGPY